MTAKEQLLLVIPFFVCIVELIIFPLPTVKKLLYDSNFGEDMKTIKKGSFIYILLGGSTVKRKELNH